MTRWEAGHPWIQRADREARHGHRGRVIWLTGLPGSGKSTLAFEMERRLHQQGCQVVVLDGDRIRSGLSMDLGFEDADRHEQMRRVAEVAALFLDAGIIVLAALITPREAHRRWLRGRFASEDFVEVYCRCSASVCMARDPKGLYARAKTGVLAGFTGVSAPYEEPLDPDVVLDTEHNSIDACVEKLIAVFRGCAPK